MNDNFPIDLDNPLSDWQHEQEDEIPVWKVIAILCASIVLTFGAGILVGTELQSPCAVAQTARDKAIQARLETMKQPIKFSLPEHYLAMTGERVDITKGAK